MPTLIPATTANGTLAAAAASAVTKLELQPRVGLHPSATLTPHAGSGMHLPSTSTGTMVAA